LYDFPTSALIIDFSNAITSRNEIRVSFTIVCIFFQGRRVDNIDIGESDGKGHGKNIVQDKDFNIMSYVKEPRGNSSTRFLMVSFVV
jgi:hypothetical protein